MATTGSVAVHGLDGLARAVAERSASVAEECRRALSRWERLCRVGGGRDDHAAALLRDTREALRRLERFAAVCGAQIDAVAASPFGREGGAA
jgi:hypothetical protein